MTIQFRYKPLGRALVRLLRVSAAAALSGAVAGGLAYLGNPPEAVPLALLVAGPPALVAMDKYFRSEGWY